MMTITNFYEACKLHQTIVKNYNAAQSEGSEMGKKIACLEMQELNEAARAKGRGFEWALTRYTDSLARGNELLDISDAIFDDQVKPLADLLRSLGIEAFTISGTWSDAQQTGWLLQENGYKLTGLVKINGTGWEMDGTRKTEAAFLYTLQ